MILPLLAGHQSKVKLLTVNMYFNFFYNQAGLSIVLSLFQFWTQVLEKVVMHCHTCCCTTKYLMLHVGVGGWIGHASLVPCHIVADENWDGLFWNS